jgi:hypothetical protein
VGLDKCRPSLHYKTLPDAIRAVGQLLKSIQKLLTPLKGRHWFAVFASLVFHDKYYLGLTK